jgi:hypothetical protein
MPQPVRPFANLHDKSGSLEAELRPNCIADLPAKWGFETVDVALSLAAISMESII